MPVTTTASSSPAASPTRTSYVWTSATPLRFVKDFFEAGQPVAVICHGPWTLVEAGVLDGRTITSWPSVRTDIENAGGVWRDEQVVVCEEGPNTLVSSATPTTCRRSTTDSWRSSPADRATMMASTSTH